MASLHFTPLLLLSPLLFTLLSAHRTSRWSICCCWSSTRGVVHLLRVLMLVYMHPVASTASPRVLLCADCAARVQSICLCLFDCCGRDLCRYGLLCRAVCCMLCAMLCNVLCCVLCAGLCTLYIHLWSLIRLLAAVLGAPLVGILAQAYSAQSIDPFTHELTVTAAL